MSVPDTVVLRPADRVSVQEGVKEGEGVQVNDCVREDDRVNDGGVGVENEELGENVTDSVEVIVAGEADADSVEGVLVAVGEGDSGL